MTKTSYFTGYTDLDEKLVKLYEKQILAERDGKSTRRTIRRQDYLLREGQKRDDTKAIVVEDKV